MNIKFRLDRETKGAVRFQETKDGKDVEGDEAFVGTLYIRKANLGKVSADYASEGKVPDSVTVAITAK